MINHVLSIIQVGIYTLILKIEFFSNWELQTALKKKSTVELTHKFLHLKFSSNMGTLCPQVCLAKGGPRSA